MSRNLALKMLEAFERQVAQGMNVAGSYHASHKEYTEQHQDTRECNHFGCQAHVHSRRSFLRKVRVGIDTGAGALSGAVRSHNYRQFAVILKSIRWRCATGQCHLLRPGDDPDVSP